jgi:hypothetical protein
VKPTKHKNKMDLASTEDKKDGIEERRIKSETKMKTKVYTRMFGLSSREVLIEDFPCAIYKTVLLHGRMFVSQNYVCFFSNIIKTIRVCDSL